MSTLTIAHWHNSYFARQRLQPEQLQQWDQAISTLDLGRDIDALLAPGELVYIRQLQLKTRLGADRSAAQAAEIWRSALLRELCAALDDEQSTDIVRYASRRDALADMLYRSCCGDSSRRWVWRQMGLIDATDQGSAMYLERVLAVLRQEDSLIWPVVTRLLLAEAATGAFSVLLQRMAPLQLQALLAACPQTRPWLALLQSDPPAVQVHSPLAETPLLRALRHWLSRPHATVQRQHAALQVLLAAAAHSGAGDVTLLPAARTALQILSAARQILLQRVPATSAAKRATHTRPRDLERLLPNEQAATSEHPEQLKEQSRQHAHTLPDEPPPEQADDDELPAPPVLPSSHERVPTDWGGLLFLLSLIPVSQCLPRLQQLGAEFDLPADALPRLLWQLGHVHYGVPSRDAALRAFCGGWQPHATLLDAHGQLLLPIPLAMLASATAAELRELLLRRLPDGEPDLPTLCRRPGMLQFESGWIELHLPLQSADTRLRRSALDLDPGWLAWLGCVVRFVYA